MSRYIKVEDMRAIFCQSNSLTQAWNGFDMLPSIDIVRCKECKWFDAGENESDSWHLCTRHFGKYINFAEDDYCSYGERREP